MSAVVITVLGVLVAKLMHDDFRSHALAGAELQARSLAAATAEANMTTDDVDRGLSFATAQPLDNAFDHTADGFQRVKVWAPDGHIVYSDDAQLAGATYNVTGGVTAALQGTLTSSVADPSLPQYARERGHGELLAVYVPLTLGRQAPAAVFELDRP